MDILEQIAERIRAEIPEVEAILQQGGTEESKLLALMGLVQSDPSLVGKLELAASHVTTKPEDKLDYPDLVMEGVGLPRLNPAYEAYLSERLQFDGDIPELRTGPMPESATPAIPVQTDATSPVALGLLLHEAAERMGSLPELYELYKPGQLPPPLPIAFDSAPLLHMTSEERENAAWKFVSTTQGRRSVCNTMQTELEGALGLVPHSLDDADTVLGEYEWVLDLGGHVQPGFDFVGTATRAILHAFKDLVGVKRVQVEAINRISDRIVGWKGVALG